MKIINQREELEIPFGQLPIGAVFSGTGSNKEIYIKIPNCLPQDKGGYL